jgi:hypothetical protein
MVDSFTHERIVVDGSGGASSHVIVRLDQLPFVESLLRQNNISYWVSRDAISINGRPEVIFVKFPRSVKADQVQALLDAAL